MSKTEKIARIVGKTNYHDLKQGFAPGTFIGDTDADIKFALGVAQSREGDVAVMALETRYARTLRHECALRRAWNRRCKEGGRLPHKQAVVVSRIGSALAIRQLAGAPLSQREVEEWAWLCCVSPDRMNEAMRDCEDWLLTVSGNAKDAFLDAIESGHNLRRSA